jgi:hypothetical protein
MKAHSWQEALWCWLSALAIASGLFCLIFFLIKEYTIRGWLNSLFPVAAVELLLPIQVLIHRTGTFDILFFSFYRLFESWRYRDYKKYDDAYAYKTAMGEKRARNKPYILPFLVVGICVLIACVVLLCFEK